MNSNDLCTTRTLSPTLAFLLCILIHCCCHSTHAACMRSVFWRSASAHSLPLFHHQLYLIGIVLPFAARSGAGVREAENVDVLNGFLRNTYNVRAWRRGEPRSLSHPATWCHGATKHRRFRCRSDWKHRLMPVEHCDGRRVTPSPRITFTPAAQGIRGRRVTVRGPPQVDSSWGVGHGDGGIKAKSKAGDKAGHSPALHIISCPSPLHLHPPLLLLLHSTST